MAAATNNSEMHRRSSSFRPIFDCNYEGVWKMCLFETLALRHSRESIGGPAETRLPFFDRSSPENRSSAEL